MGVSIVSYLLISVQATISTADPMVTNTKRSRMVTMANGHTFLLLLLLLFPGESTENYHTSSIQRCISKLVVVGEVVGEVVGHWDIIITFRNEYNHSVDDNITYDLEKLLRKNYPLQGQLGLWGSQSISPLWTCNIVKKPASLHQMHCSIIFWFLNVCKIDMHVTVIKWRLQGYLWQGDWRSIDGVMLFWVMFPSRWFGHQ